MSFHNFTLNNTYRVWLPPDFQVTTTNATCPTFEKQLVRFATYNIVAIVSFITMGNIHVKNFLTRGPASKTKPWSFWASLVNLLYQIVGTIITAVLIRSSGYKATMAQLIQLWALRPRVNWFIGNTVHLDRKWGYSTGALSHVFTEVFICSFGCVLLGNILKYAFSAHASSSSSGTGGTWWWIMVVSAIIMLISTGFEAIWAVWMIWRLVEMRGRPEAQDMDSMRWIVSSFVPITAVCSWLIWVAFLKSAEGYYCPGHQKAIDAVWYIVPVLSNISRMLIETFL
jgi:hypothetical protein